MLEVDQNVLKNYTRGTDTDSISYSCNRPFKTVSISGNGECFICICDAWLPASVGKITDFTKLEDIWNNSKSKILQQDIQDKKYTYCAVKHCGIIYNDIIDEKYYINVALDDSCNIACPSCRTHIKNYTSGPVFDERLGQVKHFVDLLNNFSEPFNILLSGSGDVLASKIMRPLVLNWQPKEHQEITLFTNGLLMKKMLPKTEFVNHVNSFWISVDAGTKEIYENVRRPATYEKMRENLDWLAENRRSDQEVILKFTLSAENVTDLLAFSEMCKFYNFKGDITKLDDWGTFNNFNHHDVIGNLLHPLHVYALEQLKEIQNESHLYLSPALTELL